MNVPTELRSCAQWVLWRGEQREDGKQTKIPYSPHTRRMASVTNRNDWGTFDEVCALRSHFDGIGFVLSPDDPFAFVDLDEAKDADEWELQVQVYERCVSYAERSPSGKGLHILCKGKLPDGKRRHSVEIYSQDRFFTFTGEVYRDMPILDCTAQLQSLHDYLSAEQKARAAISFVEDQPETISDHDLGNMAYNAANGAKFGNLWAGDWSGEGYASQSEADWALINIIAFYTNNREQVKRMFLASELGKRDKARTHRTYVDQMVERSFDRKVPPINAQALKAAIDLSLMKQRGPSQVEQVLVPTADEVSKWVTPPGMLGDIAQYIYEASPRPLREVSLIGAIGLLAGITGRAYNVSNTGLNQYLFLIGGTGIGKDAIAIGLKRFNKELCEVLPSAKTFFGPMEIASAQALQRHMSDGNPCMITYSGEIGHLLQSMAGEHPSPQHDGLKRALLSLYGSSGEGNLWNGSIYADKDKNTARILAPSFTWMGESTPKKFYGALSEDMLSEGLIPRFLTIATKSKRPDLNPNHAKAVPSRDLVNRLAQLCAECLKMNNQNRAHHVQFSSGADEILGAAGRFNAYCDGKIRNAAEDDMPAELWNRAHLKAMKLAALVAVGENYLHPVISLEAAVWAINLVVQDTENMLQRFVEGEIVSGDRDMQQVHRIALTIRDWLTRPFADLGASYRSEAHRKMHEARLVPYSFIQQRNTGFAVFRHDKRGATPAIKASIDILRDRGDLMQIAVPEVARSYGVAQVVYGVTNPQTFGL